MSLFTLLNCTGLCPPCRFYLDISALSYITQSNTLRCKTEARKKKNAQLTKQATSNSIRFALGSKKNKKFVEFSWLNAIANDRINCIQLNIFLTCFLLHPFGLLVCSHQPIGQFSHSHFPLFTSFHLIHSNFFSCFSSSNAQHSILFSPIRF